MQNYLNLYLSFKQQQLSRPVNYRGFRETGPWPGLADLFFEDFECGILCIRMKVLGFTEVCKRSESGNTYELGKNLSKSLERTLY